jgi:hypothetical protein
VHVGTIAIGSGIPHDKYRWGRRCGLYPVSHRCEHAGHRCDFRAGPHRLRTRRGSERYDVERRSGDETDAKLSVRSANAEEATIFSQAASTNRRTDDMVLAYLVELDN